MKQLLLLSLILFAGSASAQTLCDHPIPGAATSFKPQRAVRTATIPAALGSPLAENLKLSYYDASLPIIRTWGIPLEFTPLLFITFGQRMTLPNDRAYVDSVHVRIGEATGDSIMVSLVKDPLFDVGNGQLAHLIDIFEESTDYIRTTVAIKDTAQGGWLTVRFEPHVLVDKEFFITVDPTVNELGQATSGVYVIGDDTPPHTPTTENARSAFVAITPDNRYFSAVLDGVVQFNGNTELSYTNFYMEAYVDVTSSSVAAERSSHASIYPNPVLRNGTLHIAQRSAITSVSMRNVLGSEVLHRIGNSADLDLSTASLPKGVYQVLIVTQEGTSTEKVIVQ